MAASKEETPDRMRVGDYNPQIETGELLDGIEGAEVEIAKVTQEERTGNKGPYILSVIELVDGKIFHTGGPVVAEQLANVPPEAFPIAARFEKVRSKNNPTQSYWTVR